MRQQLFAAYVLLERLPESVRALNGIRSKERLDGTQAALNGYKGLEPFYNAKGQLALYKTPCRDMIDVDYRRRAEYCLSNGRLNLSSIYTENTDAPQYGYGYPNGDERLRSGEPNPLYPYRQDGYLFLSTEDYSRIEVFVVPDGRNLITLCYQQLIDGSLDGYLQDMRQAATPLFPYQGLS